MIDRNTPSDPRLQERRGDLMGRNALFFAIALLTALALVAGVLIALAPPSSGPGSSPSPLSSPSIPSIHASPSGSPVGQLFRVVLLADDDRGLDPIVGPVPVRSRLT